VHVAFAASGPRMQANKGHRRRWAIETGYRMVKRAMMRAHSKSEAVRDLCLVLSLAAHNAWVMACAGVRRAHRDGWLPQARFLLGLVSVAAGALAARPARKPPPEPPPPVLP